MASSGLNTKQITDKIRSRREICSKLTIKTRNRNLNSSNIAVNKDMLIVHQKTLNQNLTCYKLFIKKRILYFQLLAFLPVLWVFVCWARYFMIRTTIGLVSYLFQQTNTCSKSAAKTLEITDDNPKKSIFRQVAVIYDVNLSL